MEIFKSLKQVQLELSGMMAEIGVHSEVLESLPEPDVGYLDDLELPLE